RPRLSRFQMVGSRSRPPPPAQASQLPQYRRQNPEDESQNRLNGRFGVVGLQSATLRYSRVKLCATVDSMNVRINGRSRHFRTVTFDAERNLVLLIDQRILPHKFQVISTRDFRQTARAIRDMVVR